MHHFCFWHPPSFDFYIVIISPGTNEFFLPDRLEKNPIQQTSPQTSMFSLGFVIWLFVSFYGLQSSPLGKGFWLLYFNCILAVMLMHLCVPVYFLHGAVG